MSPSRQAGETVCSPGLAWRAWRILPAALAVVVLACALPAYFPFTAEDSYIVARYAENLVDKGALVFNEGEYVNALTSPLHALLESVLYSLTGRTVLSYKLLSLALLAGTVSLVLLSAPPWSRPVLAALLVLPPCVVLWTCGGLETPMLMFLVTLMTLLVYRAPDRRPSLAATCLVLFLGGLCFLTRYDAVLFAGPVCLGALARSRKPLKSIALGVPVGAVLPVAWLLWCYRVYGDIMPTSFHVKSPLLSTSVALQNASYVAQNLLYAGLIPSALVVAAVLAWRRRLVRAVVEQCRDAWWLQLGLLMVLGYGLTMATHHMVFGFRFFVPYLPATVLLVSDVLFRGMDDSPGAATGRRALAVGCFGVLMVALSAGHLWYTHGRALNGFVVGPFEYRRSGIESYVNGFLAALALNAADARAHWETGGRSTRPPRIFTFAAGLLPYTYRESYIYEELVSYRHNGRPDLRGSADYVHVLTPMLGPLSRQLPDASDIELVSSRLAMFNGREQRFELYYNPAPQSHPLSTRVDLPAPVRADREAHP